MLRRICALITAALVGLGGFPALATPIRPPGHRGAIRAQGAVTVTADLTSPGATIPADFVGYSINTMSVVPGGLLNASNTSLINLAKMLGANGVLRVGGGDQDTVTPPALTQPLANDLAAFTAALGAGWTAIYGLDAKANDSATAASQATMLVNAFGLSKISFQFGNEATDSATPEFTIAAYQTMWNSYYTAVTTAEPGAKLAGPDILAFSSVQTIINGLTPGKAGLSAITTHWYPVSTVTTWGAEQLITSVNANVPNTTASTGFFKNNDYAGSIPLRLSESQNVAGGGQDGLSNKLMSATWYLNEAIAFATHGFAGINSHMNLYWSGGAFGAGAPVVGYQYPNFYGPIIVEANGNYIASPEFNGLYLFSRIEGQAMVPAKIAATNNPNIQAIATVGAGGNANILVVNNETVRSVTVSPDQSSAWNTATVLLLSGTSCSDGAPTLGGAAIGESGAWSGAAVTINNGDAISVPACGAALVQIQP